MQQILRKEKMNLLKKGFSAYAESPELIRLIKRDISRNSLYVLYDETPTGCWFIPLPAEKQLEDDSR